MNSIQPTLRLLCIICLLLGFNAKAQNYYFTKCDSFQLGDGFKVTEQDEHEFVHSFAERAFVYCSPDSTSETLGFVNFNTTLTTIETISEVRKDSFVMHSNKPNEYRYIYRGMNWKKINFRKGYGYVKETDLADAYYEKGQFLLKLKGGDYGRGVQLKAISDEPKMRRSLDNINLPIMHGYRIRICSNNGLANSGLLIAYETYRESCPGATSIHLIVLDKNGFTNLISSYSTGEAGTFSSETVYFPIKLADGSVRLIAEGYIADRGRTEEKIDFKEIAGFPYPNHIGIPIERLVVKTKSYTEEFIDEMGAPIMEDEYNYKVNVIHNEPVFYEWNGSDLIELGSNFYLDKLDSLSNLVVDSLKFEQNLAKTVIKQPENSEKLTDKKEKSNFLEIFKGGILGFILAGFIVGIILILRRKKTN